MNNFSLKIIWHQDDARRQGVNASLQVHNKVGRNLASKEEATPSGQNDYEVGQTEVPSEGGRQASPAVGENTWGMEYPNVRQDLQKSAEQEASLFGERTNFVIEADFTPYADFVHTCMNAYYDDSKKTKKQREMEEKKKEEALLKEKEKSQKELSKGKKKVYSGPLAALEKYEDELEEERKRSLRYDKEKRRKERDERVILNSMDKEKDIIADHREREYKEELEEERKRSLRRGKEELIDDEEGMHELLLGEFKKWENSGTHTIPSSHYEVLCFEDRLNDYEINKELKKMEEMPKKCELVSLYWQSYINEKSKYINANKRLFKKFLELKKKQNFGTMGKYNNKWKKCSKIVGTNFKEQREYVNDIFYTHMTKENLSKDEFKGILGHVRDSWKEVTLKVTQECVALLEEPIVPDVKILDYDPYDGIAYFKVSRITSPQVNS
ncbi:Plasmodium exported protein, unknown function [Plasmodium knowlesi strain H]|uniref:Plasmodium RESA N-terminal domain-containing protein n=1 Tax=Plasmodium knowlesi (strain H) TaxID=5851 RepID=A0A1A7W2J0_PLAKH|nr:Plasmodium exported protein, unknown function [Plasmodium knowlesi strain H]